MPVSTPTTHTESYRLGAMSLVAAIAVILAALAFQYVGGFEPCALCLTERYAYYAGIPLLFGTLIALSSGHTQWAIFGFALVSLMFLTNTVLGGYHTGAEWGFWPGPTACTGAIKPAASIDGFLKNLKTTHVVRCDAVAIRILGLSLAVWNAVVSAGLVALAMFGFWRSYHAPSG